MSGSSVVTLTVDGKETVLVKDKEYTLSYENNINAGTATVIVTGAGGNYNGTAKAVFTIKKADQKMTATPKKAVVKLAKVKKANQTVKAVTVKNNQGKVTYKKSGSSKLTVNAKTGKITVKKGTKKGTYKIKIKVTAAGNASFNKAVKTVTVKVTVK